MTDWKKNEGWIFGGFIIASGFILFFNLWGRSLENHDYLRYAEVAREMIRSGDWVVPRYNGAVYLNKPPLLFWLIAIPSYLYGSVTPFLARFPSALSAWLGILILFLLGRRIYGSVLPGLFSAGILLSSYQFFSQARLAKTDMLLCLLILLSIYFFYRGYEEASKRRSLYFGLSFFSMGLAVLTKGPFGFFIPFTILAAFLIKEKRIRIFVSRDFLLGYFILLLIVLPWAILFVQRFGLDQSFALLKAAHAFSRQAPFYFYFIQIWGQFAPWSILLPFLGIALWRERSGIWRSPEPLILIWFVLLFVLLTLFKVRVSRYLLPALPPLALMLGGRWKKKFLYFLIPLIGVILAWHIREFYWIKNDVLYSPGKVLVAELRPILRGAPLYSYHLDVSVLEEVNFYLDPEAPIPQIKEFGNLLTQLKKEEKVFVLMTKKKYEMLKFDGGFPLKIVREFQQRRRERLVLASLSP
ncbi:MAG TPA: glycosyltransferase family 39 protein [Thermodesulfobacteriota bacterium]|nr:glycosyltransferase family 39 protein [Thermodesulfobacteriota bacterium]